MLIHIIFTENKHTDSLKGSVSSFLSITLFFFQLFDHEGEAEVTLRNTGKLGFEFRIIDPEREDEADEEAGGQRKVVEEAKQPDAEQQKDFEQNEKGQEVRPGRPMVIPTTVSSSWNYFQMYLPCREVFFRGFFLFIFFTSFCMCLFSCVWQGYVDAGAVQCLRVLYLPGVPEVFEKRLQLQVAFLPPQDITMTGEGIFPRISLNLPQNLCMHIHALINRDMIVF